MDVATYPQRRFRIACQEPTVTLLAPLRAVNPTQSDPDSHVAVHHVNR